MIKGEESILFHNFNDQILNVDTKDNDVECQETSSRFFCRLNTKLIARPNSCLNSIYTNQLIDSCKIFRLNLNQTLWFPLFDNNYLYIAPTSEKLTIKCGNYKTVTRTEYIINGLGNLTLDRDCDLRSKSIYLTYKNPVRIQKNISIDSDLSFEWRAINLSSSENFQNLVRKPENTTVDVRKMREQLHRELFDVVKNSHREMEDSHKDLKLYVILIAVFFGFVAVLVIYIIIKIRHFFFKTFERNSIRR